MTEKSLCPTAIIFDLDDTLYKEIDFLRSAYRAILQHYGCPEHFETMFQVYQQGEDAFQWLINKHLPHVSKTELLEIYRHHQPQLELSEEVLRTLQTLAKEPLFSLGIITDGRTITQQNKIKALGLDQFISDEHIVISERFGSTKPNPANYRYFMEQLAAEEYWYVGDNLKKDFVAPNQLGWKSVCLNDDGRNIHSQSVEINKGAEPHYRISSLSELIELLKL